MVILLTIENIMFKDEDEYLRWCESMVIKIYYSNIAMRDDLIREVIAEIASKLHYKEGNQQYD